MFEISSTGLLFIKYRMMLSKILFYLITFVHVCNNVHMRRLTIYLVRNDHDNTQHSRWALFEHLAKVLSPSCDVCLAFTGVIDVLEDLFEEINNEINRQSNQYFLHCQIYQSRLKNETSTWASIFYNWLLQQFVLWPTKYHPQWSPNVDQ